PQVPAPRMPQQLTMKRIHRLGSWSQPSSRKITNLGTISKQLLTDSHLPRRPRTHFLSH
ncbi:hypothetical protein FRC02_004264, partial [Tulasnella sp. 418]